MPSLHSIGYCGVRYVLLALSTCLSVISPAWSAESTLPPGATRDSRVPKRPNILFVFADDWGRFASAYAKIDGPGGVNDLIRTPNFDRVAGEGVLFRNAFVNAPSCTPCRSSLLSGQYFWRTGRGAILQGAVWDEKIPVWPLLVRDQHYHIGKAFKVWSPGSPSDAPYGGQKFAFQSAGGKFNQFSQHATASVKAGKTPSEAKQALFDEVAANFDSFLKSKPADTPFCFWFGPTNVHRKWTKGSGHALWDLDSEQLKGRMPPFLPDVPEVREDLADYFGEAMALDAALGVLIQTLKDAGEYENTLITISGDHGAPGFPHGKCNLYDFGLAVSLAIAGPGVKGGRVVDDFVSIPDLAPTFLEAAGAAIPATMTAKSLWPVLSSDKSGQVDVERTWVVAGRERHVEMARAEYLPYPQRAIRTDRYLYIINFHPERNPLGDPHELEGPNPPSAEELTETTFVAYPDDDAGPTKAWLVGQRNNPLWKAHFEATYAKRPREELYDLRTDRHQMHNVAADARYARTREELEGRLLGILRDSGDPRLIDEGKFFETPPLAGPIPSGENAPNRQRKNRRKE